MANKKKQKSKKKQRKPKKLKKTKKLKKKVKRSKSKAMPKAKAKAKKKAKTKSKPRAKVKAKPKKPATLGKVTHYYDRIGVGVVKLHAPLNVGDMIKVRREGLEFVQIVESMQMDHEPVMKARKGQEIGLKLSMKAKEGSVLAKV